MYTAVGFGCLMHPAVISALVVLLKAVSIEAQDWFTWSETTNGCIQYLNDKQFHVPTIQDCKKKCEKETGFLCRSIDFTPEDGECNLSTSNSTSGSYMEPCYSPYESDLFAEIISRGERNGPNADGSYSFNFETGDGTSVQEQGYLTDSRAVVKKGTYSLTYPDGTNGVFKWIADENGFRVESPLLPTPPPSPPHAQTVCEIAGGKCLVWSCNGVSSPNVSCGGITDKVCCLPRGCENGWHKFEGRCFKFVHQAATGSNAQSQCQRMGANIPQITNIDSFSGFIKKIGQPGGSPNEFWQIRTVNPGCALFTWHNDGKPYIKPVPCNQGGISYICEK